MGKFIVGLILGIGLATGGLALAQFFDSYDEKGNHVSGYTMDGTTTWQDNRGHSGTTYSNPPSPLPYIPSPRNPC